MPAWKQGAQIQPDGKTTVFRTWAPLATEVQVHIGQSAERVEKMYPAEEGYFELSLADCPAGTRYLYSIDGATPRPDPASRSQPEGVHSASEVVSTDFAWTDEAWSGLPLEEYVIYELHVGTFTGDGTFVAVIDDLPRLKSLGITAIELMPIAQFPGDRNWGYDGAYMYAAQYSYGGVSGFQKLVDAAHRHQIAVILDVVYNHLGPEGNYLSCFGPYFTDQYKTPWGESLNFDAAYSYGVRDFFIGNAEFWMEECHVDALRLDAVHAIIDTSAHSFLRQLTDSVHALGRHLHKRVHVIGENDRNDPRFTTPVTLGGIGADSQWSDDFHHALHTVMTGESFGYYKDFSKVSQLAKAFTDGFVFDGCYSPGRHRCHGADSRELDGIRFVAFAQNHDQVGNRPNGERLGMLLDFAQTKLTAFTLLMSPYIPLIFMGEENNAQTPFLYFVSHSDEGLIKGVREGRAREFREFFAAGTPVDPQSEDAFLQSKIDRNLTEQGSAINLLYKDLLTLRREQPSLKPLNKRNTFAMANDLRKTLIIKRVSSESTALCLFNFADNEQEITVPAAVGQWKILLDTESESYLGKGSQTSGAVDSDGEIHITLKQHSGLLLLGRHQNTTCNPGTT